MCGECVICIRCMHDAGEDEDADEDEHDDEGEGEDEDEYAGSDRGRDRDSVRTRGLYRASEPGRYRTRTI
jgi:hypothetical protein